MNASQVCQRWMEASTFYKFNRKFQLNFESITFTDNSYPMNRFMKCSRFFPNFKFVNVKFSPKNDEFWSFYGDVVESLIFNSCFIKKDDLFRILRKTPFLQNLSIMTCQELFKSWSLVKKVKHASLSLNYLVEFAIHDTSLLTKVILDFLFLVAPKLKHINIVNCLESSSSRDRVLVMDSLIEHISFKPQQIKTLNLINTVIDDMFLEGLAKIESLELSELRLTFNGTIGADNKSPLILLLRNQPNLEVLDFTESRGLTNLCVMEICKNLKKIKQLILNKCWMVNDAGVKEVSRLENLEVLK